MMMILVMTRMMMKVLRMPTDAGWMLMMLMRLLMMKAVLV